MKSRLIFFKKTSLLLLGFLLSLVLSCSYNSNYGALEGSWLAELKTEGGGLPFFIDISTKDDGSLSAQVRNGEEIIPFTTVMFRDDSLVLGFDYFDSYIVAGIGNNDEMSGYWSRREFNERINHIGFSAVKGVKDRFTFEDEVAVDNALQNITGEWGIDFIDEDDGSTSPALGVFKQTGDIVTGSVLTPTGDYRFLEGLYRNGVLKMSTFDGSRGYLLLARINKNGELEGELWNRNSGKDPLIARLGVNKLSNGFDLTTLKDDSETFDFEFPDTNGNIVSNKDPRFAGKVVILNIFGSWCPNCGDETVFLLELYEKYHDDGLEIVGLANEYTGNFVKDRDIVLVYKEKYNIEWLLLIAGTSDKREATKILKHFDKILAFPTTVFIGRDGKVKNIHTGFNGPATGVYYENLKIDFIEIIESLLYDKN